MKINTFVLGNIQTNCYLLESEKEAVIIDPAIYSDRIANYISENNLDLKYILLTHNHFDHTLGSTEFAEKFSASIAIGEDDYNILGDSLLNGADLFGFSKLKSPSADIKLSEGSIISFGDSELRVIETPGHTAGGISYFTKGHLFCGDSLFRMSIGRTDLPGGDYDTLISSICNKLYILDDDTVVYPGHGAITTIGWEKKNNNYTKIYD